MAWKFDAEGNLVDDRTIYEKLLKIWSILILAGAILGGVIGGGPIGAAIGAFIFLGTPIVAGCIILGGYFLWELIFNSVSHSKADGAAFLLADHEIESYSRIQQILPTNTTVLSQGMFSNSNSDMMHQVTQTGSFSPMNTSPENLTQLEEENITREFTPGTQPSPLNLSNEEISDPSQITPGQNTNGQNFIDSFVLVGSSESSSDELIDDDMVVIRPE